MSGVTVQSTHQNGNKMVTLVRNCLVKMTLRLTVLATSCCYDLSAMAFEPVHKVDTDQKKYRECFSLLLFAK